MDPLISDCAFFIVAITECASGRITFGLELEMIMRKTGTKKGGLRLVKMLVLQNLLKKKSTLFGLECSLAPSRKLQHVWEYPKAPLAESETSSVGFIINKSVCLSQDGLPPMQATRPLLIIEPTNHYGESCQGMLMVLQAAPVSVMSLPETAQVPIALK